MHRNGILNIFLIIAAITLLLDWYVFSGLRTFVSGWQSQRWRQIVLWGYLLISVGVTALLLFGIGSFRTAEGMTPFHEWVLSLFLTHISRMINGFDNERTLVRAFGIFSMNEI